ncbi:hypothetical protein Tco_0257350 [Tanacetum coccineum]
MKAAGQGMNAMTKALLGGLGEKTGLGYSTQLNELGSNHETDSENSLSIFDVRSSDEENTSENDRFSKNGFKAVPPPITGNFLTPRADISFAGLDEFAIRKKIIESQTTKLNIKTSETAGQTNAEKPKSVSNSKIFLQDHAVVDSGCSSHMTGNKAYLSDYEDYNGGFVAFRSDPKGDELKFNLFSILQMCDKKNSVLFTETECLILSLSFKLLDESQVVLRAPRKDDVYSLDLKNIVPSRGSSGNNKGPTQEYILLPLQPHRTRIPVKEVVQDAQEQPSENASLDKGIQVSKDVFKEEQHQMPEDEQVWQDELEMMVTQELVTNVMNDKSRQAFKEEKRRIASQKKAAQATSTNQLSTDKPFVSTGAYDDDKDVGAVADFNNMDNTIAVSPIPTLRIHKDHPKGQILGDPTSAVQTRGKTLA